MTIQNIAGSPLSSQQEHLWRLRQLDDADHYRAQSAILLEGALDKEALRRSFESVVARHEILRTTFVHPDELVVPLQVVTDSAAPAWREISARRESIDDLLEEEWRQADGALRVCLVELDSNEHVLIATLPALCADERSLSVIYEELIDCYTSSAVDHPKEILQYADYAAWQNELLAEDNQRISGDISGVSLPFEGHTTDTRARVSFSFDGDETKLIDDIARRYQVPPSAVLLACWQMLVWRLTGEADVVVGCEFEGRNFSELEGAVGLFARYLPIRAELNGRTRFSEQVTRLQHVVQEAKERQQYFTFDVATLLTYSYVFSFHEMPPPRAAADLNFSIIQQRALF